MLTNACDEWSSQCQRYALKKKEEHKQIMKMTKFTIVLHCFLISILSINSQQLQWILLSDGSSPDTPMPRRDAALGFDSSFLILYGGRDQSGMPRQDTYAFNILQGMWEPLNFPNAPSPRYGMASASSIGSGLYIYGGFGMQGSSQFYNPYSAYGQSGLASYKQNPAGSDKQKAKTINKRDAPAAMHKQNPGVMNKQIPNPMNPMGHNNYNDDDDRTDENFYALPDSWFLSYATKSWQQTQTSQYGRGFGSAAATPYASGLPRIIYSMGKSRDWMYSTVETSGQVTAGFSPIGAGQPAIIMYDLSSFNPSYPHARYGHSTTLLTENHLLLYGGCLSGYGKGGPCPSKDSWLLYIDRGHWERLWECPTTKTGAAMVTLPSYSVCASMGQGIFGGWSGINIGNDPPVAVLWGGREFNPSSIRSYISPPDEVAVFSLSQKEWYLKRVRPSSTGNFPMQREGAAFVAGCFQGAPGMFVYGGRSVNNRRLLLNDLWFLQASPQDALSSPGSRGCIYPFSFYHLHGIFQFFTYGVIFPIGYLVGRHAINLSVRRPLHMALQLFGVALAICGFAFGVHAVRAAAWLHFKHAHAIIGIITFILTIIQFCTGLIGAAFLSMRDKKRERLHGSDIKIHQKGYNVDTWGGEGAWRIGHRILGLLVLALGFVNISLGVFLAVLPLPIWIIWFIYFGLLALLIIGLEIVALLRRGTSNKPKPSPRAEMREDPKGTSQSSITYVDGPTEQRQTTTIHLPRPGVTRVPPPEPTRRDTSLHRRIGGSHGDDMAPLIPNQRQPRPGDVSSSATLPQYIQSTEREYPITTRKRSGPSESSGFDYYVGYAPEHEQQPLPRSTIQQQNEHNLTRIRLQ
ncbi:unnamed protein product [Rotaria sordida]|uniref:Cytochrome b561 domain-containing protein n=2 Tax=Rotaria sordida TaxID=392033 RepID=A0A814WGW7_9BILA|nr:unnamed protein product [Rotaria sordida]